MDELVLVLVGILIFARLEHVESLIIRILLSFIGAVLVLGFLIQLEEFILGLPLLPLGLALGVAAAILFIWRHRHSDHPFNPWDHHH